MKKTFKIVVTGGPGGGKTTALDLFQREFNSHSRVVPEAATILFKNGIAREQDPEKVKLIQKAIFEVQRTMESVFSSLYPDSLLVCDRGTIDGLAYWPGDEEEFFSMIGSTYERELARYDAVIFLETAAKKTHHFTSNNPYRTEGVEQAIELDQKLQAIWSAHQNYCFIPSTESFVQKISQGVEAIRCVIERAK
jgi:predicted ATPase